MRDVALQAWYGIALAVLMCIITLMMVTGLGSRRGTWLNRIRISLWSLVMGLGGAAACGETTYIGHPDGTGGPDTATCYAAIDTRDPPDTVDTAGETGEDTNEDTWPPIECYAAPWDPGEEDARSEPADVVDEDVDDEDVDEETD